MAYSALSQFNFTGKYYLAGADISGITLFKPKVQA